MEKYDYQLYQSIQNGNRGDFDLLFRIYYVPLCRFAFSFMKDKQLAEEAVQEVFMRLWSQASSINITSSVKSFLYVSTRNACLNLLEKHKIRQFYEEAFAKEQELLDETSPGEENELVQKMKREIEALPDKIRLVYQLKNREGLTYREISDYLDIPLKTIEKQMGKAIKILRERMSAYKSRKTA